MSIILYLPGLLVILFKSKGILACLRHIATIALTQVLFALPFILQHWRSYFQYAFDLSRVFLYKWTVNWRFIREDLFLSPQWAKGLLIGHMSMLVAFGLFRWCKSGGGVWKVLDRGLRRPMLPAGLAPVTADREVVFYCHCCVQLTSFRIRNCYDDVYIKFDWHCICPFASLPVLCMVCATNTFPGLENEIPNLFQVSSAFFGT
jgi:hypothetical protein